MHVQSPYRLSEPLEICLRTGCDTVSFIGGRGNKTGWEIWKAYSDITPSFCALATTPDVKTVGENNWSDLLS